MAKKKQTPEDIAAAVAAQRVKKIENLMNQNRKILKLNMYTREKYAEIIRQSEALEGNLNKAKEFFASDDFEALHRIVVGCQGWLREQGIISELLSGICESWYPNGQLESRGTYEHGLHHGVWKWFHASGDIEARGTYVHGKGHGIFECFYTNSQLRSRGSYVAGNMHGVWEWFHANGVLIERGTYVHGKRHGEWEWFHKNGKPWRISLYENGKLIKITKKMN